MDNVLRVHAHYTLNTSFADFEKRAGALYPLKKDIFVVHLSIFVSVGES